MPPSWAPTPGDVKGEIPQRLNGEPFGNDTVPTASQVAGIITGVANDVIGEVGSFDPADVVNPDAPSGDRITLGDLAERATTLGAASEIEDSFFPEQQTGQIAYPEGPDGGNQHLYARYRRAVETLRAAIEEVNAPGGDFTGSMPVVLPSLRTHPRA